MLPRASICTLLTLYWSGSSLRNIICHHLATTPNSAWHLGVGVGGTSRKWWCWPFRQRHIPEAPGACCHSACPGAAALSLVVSVGMQGQGWLMVPPSGGTATQSSLFVMCWEAVEDVEWKYLQINTRSKSRSKKLTWICLFSPTDRYYFQNLLLTSAAETNRCADLWAQISWLEVNRSLLHIKAVKICRDNFQTADSQMRCFLGRFPQQQHQTWKTNPGDPKRWVEWKHK